MRKNSKIKIILLVFGIIFSLSIITTLQVKKNAIKSESSVVKAAGEGEKINVTLHQSYLNTTTIEFSNISNSNIFSVACPADPTFNSSYTEIVINDIYSPNKHIDLETNIQTHEELSNLIVRATSFKVEGDGYLENISVMVRENTGVMDGKLEVVLYNATFDNGENSFIPGGSWNYGYTYITQIDVPASTTNWRDAINCHLLLDNSKTENNTWFIGLLENTTYSTECYWYYKDDGGAQGNGDNTDSVYYQAGTWHNITSTSLDAPPVDLLMKIDLSPKDNIPFPSEIGLKINGTELNDDAKGSGYWSTENQAFSDSDGDLDFEITTDWWDVSCNVTKVQINYTKTDLKANSTYTVSITNLFIWNVSINEDITCYDPRINDYNSIIFRIPADWSDIKAFNGSTEKPVDASAPAIDGYRDVIVLDAGNGTNWFLTAREDNRIRPPTFVDDDAAAAEAAPTYITNPFLFITFLAVSGFLGLGLIVFRIWQKFKRRT